MQSILQYTGTEAYGWAPKSRALLACAQLQLEMGRPHEGLAYLDRLERDCPVALHNPVRLKLELLSMRARFALRPFNAAFEHFQRAAVLLCQGGYRFRAHEARGHLVEMLSWARRQGRALPSCSEEWLRMTLQPCVEDDQPMSAGRNSGLAANYRLSPRETEIIGLVAEVYQQGDRRHARDLRRHGKESSQKRA